MMTNISMMTIMVMMIGDVDFDNDGNNGNDVDDNFGVIFMNSNIFVFCLFSST